MCICEGGTGGDDGICKLSDPQLGDIPAWSLAPSAAKTPSTADALSMKNARGRAPLPRPGFSLCLWSAVASPVGDGLCLWH